MSGQRAPLAEWRDALCESEEVDRTALLVALALSTYMNARGFARPGKRALARRSRMRSIRAVDAAVNRLEKAGFLDVDRSRGGNAKTNRYWAKLPTPQPDAGLPRSPVRGSENANPAFDDTQPRKKQRLSPQPGAGESAEGAESGGAGLADAPAPTEETPDEYVMGVCVNCGHQDALIAATGLCPECVL